jgi:hypothetical protein
VFRAEAFIEAMRSNDRRVLAPAVRAAMAARVTRLFASSR